MCEENHSMNEQKQIEEIANDINMHCCSLAEQFCGETSCNACLTNFLYNAGYRKQSENVIELFCKVGDTVYQTDGARIYELEIFDVSLRKGQPYYETESIDFDNTTIGRSIFLTKEEAEAKMKGGAE